MPSSAPGMALRIALRTRRRLACTASGWVVMYSSTDLKAVLGIVSSLHGVRRLLGFFTPEARRASSMASLTARQHLGASAWSCHHARLWVDHSRLCVGRGCAGVAKTWHRLRRNPRVLKNNHAVRVSWYFRKFQRDGFLKRRSAVRVSLGAPSCFESHGAGAPRCVTVRTDIRHPERLFSERKTSRPHRNPNSRR